MSRRKVTRRRPVTQRERDRFLTDLAVVTGQPAAQVAEQIRTAVELGWLVETLDGWQAALPADVAGPDWEGPVT